MHKQEMGLVGFLIMVFFSFCMYCEARKLSTEPKSSENEVMGLIAFKKSSVDDDPNGYLISWVSSSSTPCSWNGISCSLDGRVTELNLTNKGLIGHLQLSQLMGLPSLSHLYFSGNFFSGNLSTSDSSCSFEILDLSSNNFSEPIDLKQLLFSCSSLISVNLSKNSIPSGSFKFGSSLLQLDLSRNRISDLGLVTDSLNYCQNLNLLNFSDNKITGKLSSSLSSCKNLSTFDLSYNLLSGEIPPSLVANSPSTLKFLDLSHNNFTGNLFNLEFGTCHNLTVLNLSYNRLLGTGFPASLANCQFLQTLDLSHNAIRLKIPGVLLGNLKEIRQLSLAQNQFLGEIPLELGKTCRTLEVLDLSWNQLIEQLPSTFALCTSLVSLNLSNNQLSGDFLSTVTSSLPSLKYLYVPFNNITGHVPMSLTNATQLQVIDLSSNAFTGSIPSGFCSPKSSSLEKIRFTDNYLTGTIPSELGNCKNLKSIDLSFNSLTGSIPLEIWTLPYITDIVMLANNLTGKIPEGICINGGNLQTLILNNNLITGNIPRSFVNCTNLIWVSLSSNQLSGEIPTDIGNLLNLAILQLGSNSLTGAIPPGLGKCKSLIWLDLNSNALTGSIIPELASQSGLIAPGHVSGKQFVFVRNEGGTACRGTGGLVEFEGIREERLENFSMVHSCPSTRIYSGRMVYTFASNGSMIYLDLSYNSLSGTIPETLGSVSFLQVLNLGHNYLTGNIPFSFGGLKMIGVLDLSHNNLHGYIPGSLVGLSFLTDLDVSNNNLTGPVPSGGQLTTFPTSRYENNSGLCGVPLPPCASKNERRPSGSNNRGKKSSVATGLFIGIAVPLFCILVLTCALYRIKKYQRKEEQGDKYIESLPTSGTSSWKLSSVPEPLSINVATFEKPLRKLTFAHLLKATNGFSTNSLIGSGGFGDVYKAQLGDGVVVAIKKLIHVTGQGNREFMAEMETIGKIKHRNLVPLLGYCKIGEERLLVYEYMKWGSLESVLHGRTKGRILKIDWAARKKIAIGSARGLAFLHHSCMPHIIHRDMKSSNVLLDENFEARVSDFGMARLVNVLDTHLSVSTLAGTPGYVPPEYYQSFRCTAKGDVYSYGVVLLELLSGKRPINASEFGDDNNLVGWAKQLHKEKRVHEILDPELLMHKFCEPELYHYLKIAFECLNDKAFQRPTMIQVMAMFKEFQEDSESDILDGLSVQNSVIEESLE